MKKFAKVLLSVLLLVVLALSTVACETGGGTSTGGGNSSTGGGTSGGGKVVSKLVIKQNPTKTYYVVDDEFSVEGGIVTVTYTDGTSEDKPMTDPMFEVAVPSMSATGSKNINVKVGTKKCTFSITIASKYFSFTYVYGYDGADPETVDVAKGDKAEDKKAVRMGYTLVDWYANTNYEYAYDFENKDGVLADTTVYALWKKDGATYYDVTFNRGYYGDKYEEYSYPVESGAKIAQPSTPTRVGYAFDKWVVTGTETAYNFNDAVAGDVALTASWTKTVTGIQTYVFEAEDTDLTGKVGPAFSGTCSEKGMIVPAPANRGCSNDRFVSYLYRNQNSLEFYIACDEELTDVTLYARLSAEFRDATFNPSNYAFKVNDVAQDYAPIAFVGVPVPEGGDGSGALDCLPFQDYVIATNITLHKGKNTIQLVTENSEVTPGTTFEAIAPIVDAIKIQTTGVVIWDANKNLPFPGNY